MNTTLMHWASTVPTWERVAAGVAALIAVVMAYRALRAAIRKLRAFDLADVITVVIALATTVYAATGNWKFLVTAMHYGTDLCAVLVCALEGAVVVEGLRSRKNIAETGRAGADGVGLWVLAGLSSLLASSASGSAQEAMGRLAIPLVAAWLWERLLAPQRRARKALRQASPIQWRITGERIAVALRLADARETTASAVESARKVMRYLKATDRAARKWRRPWSPAARADRARTRLAQHALQHHGDPAAVHTELAQRMLDEALRRLDGQPGHHRRPITPTEQAGNPTVSATLEQPVEAVNTTGADAPVLMTDGHAVAINTPVLTGPQPLPPVVAKPGRPSTAEAEQIIRFCWETGMGVRETARAAGRDVGQVSRKFARLDEQFGERTAQPGSNAELALIGQVNGSS